ncbi:phosphoribosylanthranilate isomerase [Peribacillus huizhouensis]|uniref:N-(5'-phosphoribosyl)anthranilate isomerase n=1 Tax=Peribacillus huizhouensis TaxID=1501239 RepID=A0ABR6CKY8_9BACI|nr:phosphoribosylanthranilate isomerase [Peribacillus huizhouensis]MBA9025017.1 phosphoribosylanthranilate isomerase [Peribacillus huizhouensis]
MHVKICGLSTLEAAQTAIDSGADYLGFIFAESKRKVTPIKAREIISNLKGNAKKVGVFVNESVEEISRIAEYAGLDIIQLHGTESQEFASKLTLPVIKAITIHSIEDLKQVQEWETEYLLLDLPKNQIAPIRKTLNWEEMMGKLPYRNHIFLAGGLTPENVETAVKLIQPYAVDVSGGVETEGTKDLIKINAFIKGAQFKKEELI